MTAAHKHLAACPGPYSAVQWVRVDLVTSRSRVQYSHLLVFQDIVK